MKRSLETQVSQAVDAWLAGSPDGSPRRTGDVLHHVGGVSVPPSCRRPGLGADVPHGVQHGLSTRVKTIVDHAVAEYTARNLPMLQSELDQQAARNRARTYRPG